MSAPAPRRQGVAISARAIAWLVLTVFFLLGVPIVLERLQSKDPKWQVASSEWMRAIGTPEHLTGTLPQMKP